ncbi:uncharacterized protein MELLADRAFT_85991 [Melampsora larici-populina 98AG31]|uniref:Pentacotripeptide-repeat region of PRORP domain-containing protein n=1 Tax=Melampsora larici-populina (strain 98AG31 / pathotype 3-4-7) TaxID=747676 RepID=F4RKD9_MELLP|nr:uncharacterized protein MELLADRAFT_85991 [Melampsora larici-populina 98AG31]EGG07079.1 hypothetical protein MELLADRAFT_85991 [Melampsora larici-populina 98AG31]
MTSSFTSTHSQQFIKSSLIINKIKHQSSSSSNLKIINSIQSKLRSHSKKSNHHQFYTSTLSKHLSIHATTYPSSPSSSSVQSHQQNTASSSSSSSSSWWQQSSHQSDYNESYGTSQSNSAQSHLVSRPNQLLSRQKAQIVFRQHLRHHPDPINTLLIPHEHGGLLSICDTIWSHLQPGENLEHVIELQRLSISDLFLYAQSRQTHLQPKQAQRLIQDILKLLITSDLSPKILTTLGLDPIKGWRNMVREPVRIFMLNQFLKLLNSLDLPPSDWWESQFLSLSEAQLNHSFNLQQLERLGLTIITALSKQGSSYQALRLFRTLHLLLPPIPSHPFLSDDGDPSNPTSSICKAATGLILAEALFAKKRIDEADEVIRKLPRNSSHGLIHQRYLLTALSIKSVIGDLEAVDLLGKDYMKVWNAEDLREVNARNQRRRTLQRQPASLTYARARIQALSVNGKLNEAEELFRLTIEQTDKLQSLTSFHEYGLADLYAEMMKAHVEVDGLEAAHVLLDELLLNRPRIVDQRHFNLLLQGYATRTDLSGCIKILEEMIQRKVSADLHLYGNLCLMFSNVHEPASVLRVIEIVMERGWAPSRELWNILLDCYVEGGDWLRASKLLAFVESEDRRRQKEPDAVTKGIVLKALVLSGAPTDEVVETFKAMYNERTGGGLADTRAYTLLLQSVCDSGMMDLAEAIFFSLKEHAPAGVEPNVFMYGIMICAFLRLGKKSLAQFYFQDMRQYGLRPNSIIYSMITAAYARSSGSPTPSPNTPLDDTSQTTPTLDEEPASGLAKDGVSLAREMVEKFKREMAADGLSLETEQDTKLGETQDLGLTRSSPQSHRRRRRLVAYDMPSVRQQASHRLLAPIIQSYVKLARPAKALEVVKELVESLENETKGSRKKGRGLIELDVYTMLLDGYRRANDPMGVMEIWERIFKEAKATSEDDRLRSILMEKTLKLSGLVPSIIQSGKGENPSQTKSYKLCLPLSIYTDSLSSHGFHQELRSTWESVQEAGFAFDPANFNHLCLASFKSGNPRLAWEIVEYVLLIDEQGEGGGEVESLVKEEEKQEFGGWSNESSSRDHWPNFLRASVSRRRAMKPLPISSSSSSSSSFFKGSGIEETGLVRADETDGPVRPPNRTSLRKTQRFDDQLATRSSLESLLNSLRSTSMIENPIQSTSSNEMEYETRIQSNQPIMNPKQRWSFQILSIGKARKSLNWKPYEKILRRLHGSMWRECSEEIIKGNQSDENIQEIVNGYLKKYPKTMKSVLVYALGERGIKNLMIKSERKNRVDHQDAWLELAIEDLVHRVIGRTKERIRGIRNSRFEIDDHDDDEVIQGIND